MFLRNFWFVAITFYVGVFFLAECGLITPREMDIRRTNQMDIKKRPFCNAFTGCGRKRSSSYLPGSGQEEEVIDNSLSDLIDLNAEPAVEDLMRQIMSQAKLWEAIQEASREISNQKLQQQQQIHSDGRSRSPISYNSQ